MEEMPAGFRFYPTEEELICFYLREKLEEKKMSNINRVIPLLDIYWFEPWQLPKQCGELCRGDPEQWFFFVPRQGREVRGGKPSRTTASGYWKATGSPSYVYSAAGKVIGVKKSMVFYKGKAPLGRKTKWKMNEYKAIKHDSSNSIPQLQHQLSLCRIYVVSGSFRAFDRRPLVVTEPPPNSSEITRITQENDDKVANEDATTSMGGNSCSSESSFSEGNCSWEIMNCLKYLMELENV